MKEAEHLGPPALKCEGFQLWVHGREFPDSQDFFDGNWLRATAHCGAAGASVWVSGSILMVTDLVRWAAECEKLYGQLTGEATLKSYAPELNVVIKPKDQLGHLTVRVAITPDHMNQKHTFDFDIDQTALPELIRQCKAIVSQHPVRDPERWRHA